MQRWVAALEDGLFVSSRDMAPPWGPVLRALRYPAALLRDYFAGEINIRAMSLAYTTLLSIVPLLAFIVSILKAIGAHGLHGMILDELLKPMGGAAAELSGAVMQFVKNMRGDLVGSVGFLFLIYTAIATIQKIESSFHFVWRAERPRSLVRRGVEYLIVMFVGPLLLAAALGVLASAHDSPLTRWVSALVPLEWTLSALGKLLPYLIVTAVFTAMYVLIPNTRVSTRAALTGGVCAGLLWALVGRLFTSFVFFSSRQMAIYAGFALVLTTLVWIYLSWLILLIGAQLAFYVQFPQYLRHGQEAVELAGGARERAALSVMVLIATDYAAGKLGWTLERLAAELDLPSIALAPVIGCLERDGLILETSRRQLVPARDIAAITLVDIVAAARAGEGNRSLVQGRDMAPTSAIVAECEAAVRQRLAGRTLLDLIAPGGHSPAIVS